MSAFTDALTRLSTGAPTGYNNGGYNASTNPYGFSEGGHRTNIYLLTADLTLVTNTVIEEIEPIVELTDEIAALAAITAAISAVAAIDDDVAALALLTSQITALGAITASITALAPRAADIATLAPRATDIGLLADIQDGTTATGAITTVATNATAVANVSSNMSAVTAVAAALSNINTVAGIASAVSTVAGISAAVSTVSANNAAVSTTATNIAAIIAAPTEATNAAASAVTAAAQAAALRGTSASSVAIGTGSKTFTTQSGKQWAAGDWVTITDDAAPTVNWMSGQVTSYSSTTLQVGITAVGGSGTKTAWHIGIAGVQGPPAAGTGDFVGVGSSVAHNLVAFADMTGKLAEDSGIATSDVFLKSTDDLDDISPGTTNKQFTNTEKTKLAAIEASADVTDAANVAAAISGASAKGTPVDNDRFGVTDSAASHALVYVLWSQIKATLKTYFDTLYSDIAHTHAFSVITGRVATLEADIHALTGKTTPVDADELPLIDSAASNVLKKLTWANLKAGVFAAWGALVAAGTQKGTPVDADAFVLADSAASNATKRTLWSDIKATLKAYFDPYYATPRVQLARNGSRAIAQRAMPTTDNQYCLDGHRVLMENANGCTVSQVTANPPTGAIYGLRLTVGSGNNGKFGYFMPIEYRDIADLLGRAASVLERIKATAGLLDGGNKICVAILYQTGTADSVAGDPVSAWGAAGVDPTLSGWTQAGVVRNCGLTTHADYKLENVSIPTTATNVAIFAWSDDRGTTATTDWVEFWGGLTLTQGASVSAPIVLPIVIERSRAEWRYKILTAGLRVDGYFSAGGQVATITVAFPPMASSPSASATWTTATNLSNGPFLSQTSDHLVGNANTTAAGAATGVLSAVTLDADL